MCMHQGNQMVVCDGGVACHVSEIRVHTIREGMKKIKILKKDDKFVQATIHAMLDQQAALDNIAFKFLQDDMDIHALHVEFKAPFPWPFQGPRDKKPFNDDVFEVEIRYILPV